MVKNPTIGELNDPGKFEKIAEIQHSRIKDFVFEQIRNDKLLIPVYMVYQVIMILLGTFFVTRSVVLIIKGFPEQFYWTMGSVVLSFSVLVILHESFHGLALLLTGAKKISFGSNLRNFMFFAEADLHVMNRRQFRLVALTPLIVVKIVCLYGFILYFKQPASYLFVVTMCLHSLFCAGDIGLLSFIENQDKGRIYTYDSKKEDKTFYFKKL